MHLETGFEGNDTYNTHSCMSSYSGLLSRNIGNFFRVLGQFVCLIISMTHALQVTQVMERCKIVIKRRFFFLIFPLELIFKTHYCSINDRFYQPFVLLCDGMRL